MKKYNLISDGYAVSEVVGGMLLIIIAVLSFSAIYMYVLPLPIPPSEPHVKLMGYVDDNGSAVIQHVGGEPIDTYRMVVKNVSSGTLISSTVYQGEPWEIGECKFPHIESPLLNENERVQVTVYTTDNDGNEQQIFDGILEGRPTEAISAGNPMLISSLRTNTVDEDLICFNYTINQEGALTYIYNWSVNGNSIASLLMPFDTNSTSTTRDYSDHKNDGHVSDATWTKDGKVGGAYSFDGVNDHIDISLPNVFDNIPNNDFTTCMWVKCGDIGDQRATIMEARKDASNFVQFFQFNSEIHFGICENGLKSAVKTGVLSDNTWYQIAGVWDASEKSLVVYVDGNISTEIGNRNYGGGSQEALHIGQRTDNSKNWNGTIDEFQIYGHALSSEEIYQYYLCSKDGFSDKSVIVSEETNVGESWKCVVTPNDGNQDGEPVESNIINIINYGGG